VDHWQGRLALNVQSTPAQSFSASFDLQGSAQAGNLVFTTPLGTTVARLQWDASSAMLYSNGEPQKFDSLENLVHHATGTDLPIASMFAWLRGIDASAPGWQVDLSALPAGRLAAHRSSGDAPAELKILLDN
jgi:outer membrane lipoprotein LolB